MPKRRPAYPDQFWRVALRLVGQGRSIPVGLGVWQQRLRNWRGQGERDRGERDDGLTGAEREELRELRKRVKRLEQERVILKHATAFFPHGGQFIGLTFGQSCHDAGNAQSMGAVGSCFDNAVAETFFATLTKELLLHNAPKGGWATRAELRSAVFEFIEGYYNPTRLHS